MNLTSTADLDKLIQSFEYENQQYVKFIEKENQHIEALQAEIFVKRNQTEKLQGEISQLDEDTKRAHKQFIHNRDNCDSLKKTNNVMKDHEVALEKTLKSLVEKGNLTRKERANILQHYRDVWQDYEAKYKSFPLAKELEAKKESVQPLQKQVKCAEEKLKALKKQIDEFNRNHDVDFRDLKKLIIRIADLKTTTSRTEKEIKKAYRTKQSLEEEIRQAEKVQMEQEAERIEKEKTFEKMELEEQSGHNDSSETSTLINMMKDSEEDENANVIIKSSEKSLENLFHPLQQHPVVSTQPQYQANPRHMNRPAASTGNSYSSAQSMETDIVSPEQITLVIEDNSDQCSKTSNHLGQENHPSADLQGVIPILSRAPKISSQINRPVVPQSPHLVTRKFVTTQQSQIPVQYSTPSYITRTPVPQVSQNNRYTVPQISRPTVQQISSIGPIKSCTSYNTQHFIRPLSQQTRPRTPIPQVTRHRMVAPPPPVFQTLQTPQLQTRPTNRVVRPQIQPIPAVTEHSSKQTVPNKLGQTQIRDQPHRVSPPQAVVLTPTDRANQKSSEQKQVENKLKSPGITQESPKTPKTPESMSIINEMGGFSPFDMEKHQNKLRMLKQSPGVPTVSSRPMYSADKIDPSKKQGPGIFTGNISSMMDTKNKSSSLINDKDFTGFATELAMFQSSGGDTFSSTEKNFFDKPSNDKGLFGGGNKATNLFGCKSPDLNTHETGFNFGGGGGDRTEFSFGGGSEKSEGSSIMSLFGDSSSENQIEETSFSFSFGGSSVEDKPNRGFSLF